MSEPAETARPEPGSAWRFRSKGRHRSQLRIGCSATKPRERTGRSTDCYRGGRNAALSPAPAGERPLRHERGSGHSGRATADLGKSIGTRRAATAARGEGRGHTANREIFRAIGDGRD
jgi:hypothetical protein